MTKLEGAANIQGIGIGAMTGAVMTLTVHPAYIVPVAMLVMIVGVLLERRVRNQDKEYYE